jgi:nucleoside phosphorylase
VSGKDHKLRLGALYGSAVCDMESGAFAYVARRKKARFFNLRVVADTLDETLSDYFQKEGSVTLGLGERAAEALKVLDELLG